MIWSTTAAGWDRQPYLTKNGVDDGYTTAQKYGAVGASIVKKPDVITKNMWINGYNGTGSTTNISPCSLPETRESRGVVIVAGVWTIDHDDGSQYWNDTSNLMV